MQFKDYYKILGVQPEASAREIKAAYRKLARRYHPDVSDDHQAEDKFKEVTEAYEVLKSAEKRAEYDEIRQYGQHGQSFTPPPGWEPFSSQGSFSGDTQGFSEFFSSIFGHGSMGGREGSREASWEESFRRGSGFSGGESPKIRGQDIETEMPVFLEDTLAEQTKPVSYQLAGMQKNLKVKIPAGVGDGERIRLKGQGAPGAGGGPNGDLYLRIRMVPHPLFDVEGHNLIITVSLAPWEAALGCKVTVPTLSGSIQLTIPKGSQTGQRLRVKGKGLVTKVGCGDLHALLKVVMPSVSNSQTEQLWKDLSKAADFNPRAEWRDI